MTFQEKRTLMSMLSGVAIFIGYGYYLFQTYPDKVWADPTDFAFWGKALLIMIPISIVARIIIHIVFTILHAISTGKYDDQEYKTDERDKLIELKASRVSQVVFMSGFLLSMGALAMGYTPFTMFLVLVFAGLAAEIFEGISKIVYYRRGF
jgi:nitrogen fixation-related uncharacterized protein